MRFGEVEARGVALTPQGRERYDAAMAAPDPAAVWADYFPATDEEMAASGLAYYHGGDPSKPVVYEDFLPASAAGIFRSNLDTDTQAAEAANIRTTAWIGWPVRSDTTFTTHTSSTRKSHHHDHRSDI